MKQSFVFSLFAMALAGVLSLLAKESPSTVRLHLDVDRATMPADSTERAVIKVGLDCLRLPHHRERPPVNLSLVIDKSGSMGGDKIARAREAALELVGRLGSDDIVSLVVYDSEVCVLVPAQRVGSGQRLRTAIHSIEAGGNTALHGGVVSGAAEVRRHIEDNRYVNRVILLSDGLANVGPSTPEELGRLGASLMKEGISVTTIGLGLGYNEDLMARLAQRSDGNTYFVEHSADLPRIFATELGDVLNVVARRVVIEIDFPAGVRPVAFVGREGRINGQRAALELNQLYGGQEKFALVEVEVAPSAAGGEREIARAQVRYEDALTRRTATLESRRNVRFSGSREAVVQSANHRVQADYAANKLADAKDQAIALVDAGKKEDAAKLLREEARQLSAVAATYNNAAVKEAAAAAAPAAAKIERDGLSNAERKSYRSDSQQVRNQQSSATTRP